MTGRKDIMQVIVFTTNNIATKFIDIILDSRLELAGIVSNNKDVKEYAKERDLHLIKHPNNLLCRKYDLGLSISNLFILSDEHIKVFRKGIINFHAAPISKYKGSATPIFHILEDDEKKWGYTYHMISDKLDKGDIIEEVIFDVPELSSGELDNIAITKALEDFPRFINKLLKWDITLTPQKNGKIWSRKEVDRYIRAFDWSEVVEHLQVRLVPEKTYQELIKIYRRYKNDDNS